MNNINIKINPSFSEKLGLVESVIFCKIKDWVEVNKRQNRNFKEGKYWTYNSIREWKEKEFAYLKENEIRYAIKKLERAGYILSNNFNAKKSDRTKWYTINDEKIKELEDVKIEEKEYSVQNNTINNSLNEKNSPQKTEENLVTCDYNINTSDSIEYYDYNVNNKKIKISEQIKMQLKPLNFSNKQLKHIFSIVLNYIRYLYKNLTNEKQNTEVNEYLSLILEKLKIYSEVSQIKNKYLYLIKMVSNDYARTVENMVAPPKIIYKSEKTKNRFNNFKEREYSPDDIEGMRQQLLLMA